MCSANSQDWQVIVVGAGPVGLSLALGLAQHGVRVLVLEQQAATAEHSRAPAIWPSTQQILAQLGVVDSFFAEGIVLRHLQLWDADRQRPLLSLPLEELSGETPFPQLLILPQARTEQLLLHALQREPTARVQFSCQVTDLAPDESKVEVRYTHAGGETSQHTLFVAGCDGAHSTVRDQLGASFDGTTYSVRAALADVEIDRDADLPFPRITTQPNLAIAIRISKRLWRLILPFADSDNLPLDQRVAEAVASHFRGDYRTIWQSEFHLHQRVSSRFASGRIVLAGDAAHLNSPVGGQGMNAGIQDSALLAVAIRQALQSGTNDPIMQFATRRQNEVRAGVNHFTDLLTRTLLFQRGRFLRPLLRVTSGVLHIPALRHRFLRRLAMLD